MCARAVEKPSAEPSQAAPRSLSTAANAVAQAFARAAANGSDAAHRSRHGAAALSQRVRVNLLDLGVEIAG